MSTTIYNGKILTQEIDNLYKMNNFYKNLRSTLIPIAKREYRKFIVRIAQGIYTYIQTDVYPDDYHIDLNEIKTKSDKFRQDAKAIVDYAREYANKAIKKTSEAVFWYDGERDADFDVSICLLPICSKTLCLTHANNDALEKTLNIRPEFSDYAYWNNTDRPENLSEAEWEQRRKDWDEALPGIGIPRNNGVVVKIVDGVSDVTEPYIHYILDDFTCYLQSDEDILTKVVRRLVIMREYDRLAAEYEANGDETRSASTVAMRNIRLAYEYFENHPEEAEQERIKYQHTLNSKEFFSTAIAKSE